MIGRPAIGRRQGGRIHCSRAGFLLLLSGLEVEFDRLRGEVLRLSTVLKRVGQVDKPFGQVVVVAPSIAEGIPIVLVSVLCSAHSAGVGSTTERDLPHQRHRSVRRRVRGAGGRTCRAVGPLVGAHRMELPFPGEFDE